MGPKGRLLLVALITVHHEPELVETVHHEPELVELVEAELLCIMGNCRIIN
jgi:hypothetical protein